MATLTPRLIYSLWPLGPRPGLDPAADTKQTVIPAGNRTLGRPSRSLLYRLSLSESCLTADVSYVGAALHCAELRSRTVSLAGHVALIGDEQCVRCFKLRAWWGDTTWVALA